jgi:hypothetical protein
MPRTLTRAKYMIAREDEIGGALYVTVVKTHAIPAPSSAHLQNICAVESGFGLRVGWRYLVS